MSKEKTIDMKALKDLQMKMHEFTIYEAKWIDALVREQYPRWVMWLGELALNPTFRFIQKILSKFSGLEIVRSQEISKLGKGYRPGSIKIESLTTKVFRKSKWQMFRSIFDNKNRKGRMIAERTFSVGLVVRGDLNKILQAANTI